MKIPMPSHAYVPGATARHGPDAFAAICDTVRPDMDGCDLAETAAWKAGLVYLENGYFWEAHEVLEPVWMALSPESPERRFVQAVIQLANAELKARMGRAGAVLRLCAMVEALIHPLMGTAPLSGLSPADIQGRIAELRQICQAE